MPTKTLEETSLLIDGSYLAISIRIICSESCVIHYCILFYFLTDFIYVSFLLGCVQYRARICHLYAGPARDIQRSDPRVVGCIG